MSRYQREKSSERGVISVTNASALSCLGIVIDEMDLPVYIVAVREVCPEMAAATLLAAERRARDQPRNDDEVARRGILRRCRRCRIELRDGVCQAVARSKHSDLAPHQIANLGARDRLVRRSPSCPGDPRSVEDDTILLERRRLRR